MIFCKNKYIYPLSHVILNSHVYSYMFTSCHDVRNVNLGHYLALSSACNISSFVGSFISDIICFLSSSISLLTSGKKLSGNSGISSFSSKWSVFPTDEWAFFISCFVKGALPGLVFGLWVTSSYSGSPGAKLTSDLCFDRNIDCKRIKAI